MRNYCTESGALTLNQVELLYVAAKEAANWANHGSTCRGFLGYSTNENGDRIAFRSIPPGDEFKWWQAFDESQCSCGIKALRDILWRCEVSNAYRNKETKRLVGSIATRNEGSNIDSLKAEVDALRNEVLAAKTAQSKAEENAERLQRKLKQVLKAANVARDGE